MASLQNPYPRASTPRTLVLEAQVSSSATPTSLVDRQPSLYSTSRSEPARMATLLSLANETLLQIIEETRPDSIWNFLRCCKRFWIVGAEGLEQHRQDRDRYRSPSFWFWAPTPEYDLGTYEYLAELLVQPRHALYVNSVSVYRGFNTGQYREEGFEKKMWEKANDVCVLLWGVTGCGFHYIQSDAVVKHVKEIYRGDAQAAIRLMLTILPNLTMLTINEYDDHDGYADLIYKVSKTNQSSQSMNSELMSLNKLETITINDASSMNRPDQKVGIFEVCMTLPSLRSLKGKYINCHFDHWPSEVDLPSASNVTEIIFDRSAITAESFNRLLSRTKILQRLTYQFVKLLGAPGDLTAMSLKPILEQHTASTLTHLDLDFNGFRSNEAGAFIGSLRQLEKLQHLRIQASMFVLSDRCRNRLVDLLPLLPASIETLTLFSQGEDQFVTYTLDDLREKREEYLPRFKTFTRDKTVSIASGLVDECASVGIDLVYA